jgi:hypothetical protein
MGARRLGLTSTEGHVRPACGASLEPVLRVDIPQPLGIPKGVGLNAGLCSRALVEYPVEATGGRWRAVQLGNGLRIGVEFSRPGAECRICRAPSGVTLVKPFVNCFLL